MNIVFLENAQNFGGSNRSTLELAERLQNKGFNILIIDFWGSSLNFIKEANRLKLPIKIIDKRDKPIILSHPNKLRHLYNYFYYLYKFGKYRKKTFEIISKFSADLIVVNNVKSLSLLRKSKKYRISYFARGWFLPKSLSGLDKYLIKRSVKIFIGVSEATRHAIYAGNFTNMENIYVVPNAIDFNKYQKLLNKDFAVSAWDCDISKRRFTIIHCGGFIKTKGQHIVIEIAHELKKRNINFRVLLVGMVYKGYHSNKYFEMIKDNIINLGLEDYVEIVLNKSNVIEYFAMSDILIHPSSTEGLPRVVMEAMSLGKPVIGNPVGGMIDLITNNYNGFLTNYNNVIEYVTIIENLFLDKELYSFISKNASTLIRDNYTIENQIKAFTQISKQ